MPNVGLYSEYRYDTKNLLYLLTLIKQFDVSDTKIWSRRHKWCEESNRTAQAIHSHSSHTKSQLTVTYLKVMNRATPAVLTFKTEVTNK